MRICLQAELSTKVEEEYLYLPKIVLTDKSVMDLLVECDRFDDLLPIINKINKQGIMSIGPISKVGMMYTRKMVRLPFSSLSHAELVFLVTYAALKLDRGIIVQHDIKQLEKDTFQLYYRSFSELDQNNRVMVIADTFYNRDWLQYLVGV